MRIVYFIYRLINLIIYRFFTRIKFHSTVKCKGIPLIESRKGGKVVICENVILNSWNLGYHLNMHSRVKLFSEGANAEIRIGMNTRINGACIHARDFIRIGSNCLIGANTQIIDSDGHELMGRQPENRVNSTDTPKGILIEDNVWLGANVIVLKGTTIGKGAVVAIGSVVTSNVESNTLVGGVPAKFIKKLSL